MSQHKKSMDIPEDVLEDLKCDSCGGFLSRSPVYLQHDGTGVCGQCYAPERPATLNKQYQALAKLQKFPCKNWELGCRETVPFAAETEEIAHEAVCEYRQYVCPVLGSARCDWVGPRTAMLAHCRAQHPDRVLDNPCSLTQDIARASLQNYIISAFQVLFLLHTKVCVATGKIFHAVRLVGGANQVSDYTYTLDIKREDEQVTKKGQVAPEGCLAIQEDSSVAVNTNSLLDMLGGFDGTTFTVTLKRAVSAAAVQLALPMKKCRTCRSVSTAYWYRRSTGWWCERCIPGKRLCENRSRGCTFTDITGKNHKHLRYFCQERTRCYICDELVLRGTLDAHYGSAHQDITYRAGSTWWAKQNNHHCLLTRAAGTAVCWYELCDSKFILEVYIPVPWDQLRKFRCSVQVTDPATGQARNFTPDLLYNKEYDWRIYLKKNDFPSWNVVFDVCVVISKIKKK